jgi:hypothetical protein
MNGNRYLVPGPRESHVLRNCLRSVTDYYGLFFTGKVNRFSLDTAMSGLRIPRFVSLSQLLLTHVISLP